jgi:hypothetical protein
MDMVGDALLLAVGLLVGLMLVVTLAVTVIEVLRLLVSYHEECFGLHRTAKAS